MLREHAAGTYQRSAYLAARTISDLIVQLLPPILFSIIVYPTIGYHPGASRFFTFVMFLVLDVMAATSLATMVSCICVSVEMSTIVMSTALEITRLHGGFFIKPSQYDIQNGAWKFAQHLSFINYVYCGLCNNQFSNLEISCTADETARNKCIFTSGQQVIDARGYDIFPIGIDVVALLVYFVLARYFTYLALKYIKY